MARPRLVSDEDICTAVRRGVLEQGPQVSLDVIAERLGVSAPALFKRFGSRNALLIAALKFPEHPPFIALLESGPDPDRTFEAQLQELMEAHMRFLEESWPCMVALRESGIPKEEIKGILGRGPVFKAVPLLAAWLERANKLGLAAVESPGAAAMAIFGAGQLPVMLRHMQKLLGGPPPNVDGYAKSVARMVSRGVTSTSPRVSTPRKRVS